MLWLSIWCDKVYTSDIQYQADISLYYMYMYEKKDRYALDDITADTYIIKLNTFKKLSNANSLRVTEEAKKH